MDRYIADLLIESLPKKKDIRYPITHPLIVYKLLEPLYGLEDLKIKLAKFLANPDLNVIIVELPIGGGKTTITTLLHKLTQYYNDVIDLLKIYFKQHIDHNEYAIKEIIEKWVIKSVITTIHKNYPQPERILYMSLHPDAELKFPITKYPLLLIIDNFYALTSKAQNIVKKYVLQEKIYRKQKVIIFHTRNLDPRADSIIDLIKHKCEYYKKEKFSFDEVLFIINKALINKGYKPLPREILFILYSNGYDTPGKILRLFERYGSNLYDYNFVIKII